MFDLSYTVTLPFESGFVSESLSTIIEITSEGIFSGVSVHVIGERLSAPKFEATGFTHNLFVLLLVFGHFPLHLGVHQGTFAEMKNASRIAPMHNVCVSHL